jgi:hypothetical protein
VEQWNSEFQQIVAEFCAIKGGRTFLLCLIKESTSPRIFFSGWLQDAQYEAQVQHLSVWKFDKDCQTETSLPSEGARKVRTTTPCH